MPSGTKSNDTTVLLSPKEMKRMAKPKPGFERFASTLLELVEEGRLPRQIVDVQAVRDELTALVVAERRVSDAKAELRAALSTRFWHGSRAWKSLLTIYDYARLAARRDSRVRIVLRPFVQFMRRGRKRKAKKPAPTP